MVGTIGPYSHSSQLNRYCNLYENTTQETTIFKKKSCLKDDDF